MAKVKTRSGRPDRGKAVANEIAYSLPSASTGEVIWFVIELDSGSIDSVVGNNGGAWSLRRSNSNGGFMIVYESVVGATPDTEITITTNGSSTSINTTSAVVVQGADTAGGTSVHASAAEEFPSAISHDAPDLETTIDNCLILIFYASGTGAKLVPEESLVAESAIEYTFKNFCGIASTFKKTAGFIGPKHFYVGNSVNTQAQFYIVAIKDDGTNDNDGYIDPLTQPCKYLHLMLDQYSTGELGDNTIYDPTSVSNEGITSLSNGSYSPPSISQFPATTKRADVLGFGFETPAYYTNSALNELFISGFPITETYGSQDNYDLSGEIVVLNFKLSSNSFKPRSSIGTCFGLSDKTNAVFWQTGTIDTVPSPVDGIYPTLIEVDASEYHMDEVGTFNSSDVGAVIVGAEPTATSQYMYPSFISLMRPMVLNGKCSFATAEKISRLLGLNTVYAHGGLAEGQYICNHEIVIGGSDETQFDSTNEVVKWTTQHDGGAGRINSKLSEGALKGLTFDLNPGEPKAILGVGLYDLGWNNKVVIASTHANEDNIDWRNKAFVNTHFVLADKSNINYAGFTSISGLEIEHNGADISGNAYISKCKAARAWTATSQAELDALTGASFIDSSNIAITITGDHTSLSMPENMTFSGNVVDVEYTGSTNLTLLVPISSNSLTLTLQSGAGTITLDTPAISLQITSDKTALLQVYTGASQTVLNSATDTSLNHEYTGTPTYDVEAKAAGYLMLRVPGLVMTGADYPLAFSLIPDPVYKASHGLTYGADVSYNPDTKKITVLTSQNGVDLYSCLIDAWISEAALRNTDFPIQMNGPTAARFLDGVEFADVASQNNWRRVGVIYLDANDNELAVFSAVFTQSTVPGAAQFEYQQEDGLNTADAINTGAIDQLIQVFGDATHGNFTKDSHLVVKCQLNGYAQIRIDLLALNAIVALDGVAYAIPTPFTELGITTGDPGLAITIIDHTSSPITKGGELFDYEIQDPGVNSGLDILRQLNFNNSGDGVTNGLDAFNWPDIMAQVGEKLETLQGIIEGGGLSGFYVSRGGNDHPDFLRFQSNDGDFYTPVVQNNATISNMPTAGANILLQIYNTTTASLIHSADPSGVSYLEQYVEGSNYSEGDEIRVRFAELNAGATFKSFATTVTAGASGWSLNAANFIEEESVYAENATNGSLITKFTYSPVDDHFNLVVAQNWSAAELFAFYCYILTTPDGIEGAFGAFVAINSGNYMNVTSIASIFLDNETTASQRQTDNARVFRDDDVYPVLDPTTSGYGIDVNWKNVVHVVSVGGSSLDANDKAQLADAASNSVAANTKLGTPVDTIAEDIANVEGGGGGGSAIIQTGVLFAESISPDSTFSGTAIVDPAAFPLPVAVVDNSQTLEITDNNSTVEITHNV